MFAPPDKAVVKSVDDRKENETEEQCSVIGAIEGCAQRWGNV